MLLLFSRSYIENKTLLLLAVHSRTTVGELAARAKTNSLKEQLQKPLQNFKIQISSAGKLFDVA
jgi:hypothetical protein